MGCSAGRVISKFKRVKSERPLVQGVQETPRSYVCRGDLSVETKNAAYDARNPSFLNFPTRQCQGLASRIRVPSARAGRSHGAVGHTMQRPRHRRRRGSMSPARTTRRHQPTDAPAERRRVVQLGPAQRTDSATGLVPPATHLHLPSRPESDRDGPDRDGPARAVTPGRVADVRSVAGSLPNPPRRVHPDPCLLLPSPTGGVPSPDWPGHDRA